MTSLGAFLMVSCLGQLWPPPSKPAFLCSYKGEMHPVWTQQCVEETIVPSSGPFELVGTRVRHTGHSCHEWTRSAPARAEFSDLKADLGTVAKVSSPLLSNYSLLTSWVGMTKGRCQQKVLRVCLRRPLLVEEGRQVPPAESLSLIWLIGGPWKLILLICLCDTYFP